MKKLIICLFTIAISFMSYAQSNRNDTTYFVHKNIQYAKVKSYISKDQTSYSILNVDPKYVGTNLFKGRVGHYKTLEDYHNSINAKLRKDIMAIWFKYVKENFTNEEKMRILNFLKTSKFGTFYFFVFIELDGSTKMLKFSTNYPTYKDEDIANLDLLVRENLALESSGLPTQFARVYTSTINRELYIQFLEKELNQEK